MTNKSMGEIISILRKEKGMTQKEIADRLGITDKAVSKWERDVAYPDTGTIPKLAEILGVTVPLRYNYDKPEKPRISRVFGYQARFFILFQPEKSSREVVIS